MSLESISMILTISTEPPAALTCQEIFRRLVTQWLPNILRPFEGQVQWGDRRETISARSSGLTWRGENLWPGEKVDESFPLSFITPDAPDIEADLLATLPREPAESFQFSLAGALLHTPPLPGAERGWYGRLVRVWPGFEEGQLLTIASVYADWSPGWKEVQIEFPIGGYPLTSHLPEFDEEGRIETAKRMDLVASNRSALTASIPAVERILNLPVDRVNWTIDGEALLAEDLRFLQHLAAQLKSGDR